VTLTTIAPLLVKCGHHWSLGGILFLLIGGAVIGILGKMVAPGDRDRIPFDDFPGPGGAAADVPGRPGRRARAWAPGYGLTYWGRCRIRTAAASSPITDGRCTPTSAMHLPATQQARARTTTAGTGT